MNIPRYTLPVFIAAGLHGALFLSSYLPTAGTPVLPPAKTARIICIAPEEPFVLPPENPRDADDHPVTSPRGGDPRPELPDTTVATEISDFVKPEVTSTKMPIQDVGVRQIGPFQGVGGPGIGDGFGDPAVIGFDQLDRAPNARVQRAPEYPPSLKQQGVSGSVVVEFSVDREGRVVTVNAVRYTHREFVEPALRAVKTWRFEPGKRLGRPVAFRMMIPIEFGIDN